jgi:myosin I
VSLSGWWLVKRGNNEGWAPYNYLELIPPKPVAAPPPPPVRRQAPVPSPAPQTSSNTQSSWKQKQAAPSNGVASANLNKPHPKPPITGPKPGASSTSKVGNKPPVPSTARPPVGTAKPATGIVKPAAAPPGQMDLAAMVSLIPVRRNVIADQAIARQARAAVELIIREEFQKLEVRSDVQITLS